MGNEVSNNSGDRNQPTLNKQLDEPNSHFFHTDNFSYNGIKSDLNSSISCGSNVSVQTADKTNDDDRVPTKFEWKDGGSMVYVTGSFVNWTQWFIMQREGNNHFELTLELTRGVHQFKFIVDSVWRYSHHLPIQKDSKGNINNYVDNSSYKKPEKLKEKTKESKEEKINLTKGSAGAMSEEFGDIIPKRSDMNTESPIVPVHYEHPFCKYQNTRQHLIGNQDLLHLNDHYYSSENSSFKCVNSISHVSL